MIKIESVYCIIVGLPDSACELNSSIIVPLYLPIFVETGHWPVYWNLALLYIQAILFPYTCAEKVNNRFVAGPNNM